MDRLVKVLESPLAAGLPVRIWHVVAAVLVLAALALIIWLCIMHRPRSKKRAASGTTLRPAAQDAAGTYYRISNLQGVGARTEQQDAFYISPVSDHPENGLLAVLCDGMGGMSSGRDIAGYAVSNISSRFPYGSESINEDAFRLISDINGEIYAHYRGIGGTTLVAVYIEKHTLRFWCVGDSDLMLMRDGRLYPVNCRHEYLNTLFTDAVFGRGSVAAALNNPQKGALTSFMGAESKVTDMAHIPFELKAGDRLLLCSDGVSDVLNTGALCSIMQLDPYDIPGALEREILSAALPEQDNYTAIIISVDK